MALDTYAALQTSIANTLHRADLSSSILDFITLADSRINCDLRVRQMETTQASTIAAGVLAVPSNYIELLDAYISSTSPYGSLTRKTSNWIYDNYPQRSADQQPRFIAREGSSFIFGPFPDSNYTVILVYYNRFKSLSAELNSIFSSYPGLWLYAALCESAPFLKNDQRIPMWEAKYKYLFDLIQKESDDEYISGDVLQVVPG